MKLSDIATATGGVSVGDCVRVIAAQADFEKQIAELNRACPTGSFTKLGSALVYYNANAKRIFLRFGNKKSFGGPVLNWEVLPVGTSKPTATGTIAPSTDSIPSVLKAYIKEPKGKSYSALKNSYVEASVDEVSAASLDRDPLAQGLVLLNRCLVNAEHELKKSAHPIDVSDSQEHKQADEVAEDIGAGIKVIMNTCLNPDKRNQRVGDVYNVLSSVVRNFIGIAGIAEITPENRKRLKSYYIPRAKQTLGLVKSGEAKIADIADFVDCIHSLAVDIARFYEN